MELHLYYRLRAGQTGKPGKKQLQIRLRFDDKTETETASDYASGVYVRPQLWDQSDQQCTGRSKESAEINERLSEIELQHRAILRDLKARYGRGEGPRPTVHLIKQEFIDPGSSDPALLSFYPRFYSYQESLVGSEDEKAKKTMDRFRTTEKYLTQFTTHYCQQNKFSGRLTLRSVTTAFGKQYHAWLQVMPETGKRRMQKDSANKYLSVLRDCLEYAIECGYLSDNKLNKFRPKRGKSKDIYFLDDCHIDRLLQIKTTDRQYSYVLWWVRLMCWTGLDYIDAVKYARARTEFERPTPDGVIIHIKRSKPPRNYCEIPLHPIVEVLFGEHPTGPPDPSLADMNRHLKILQAEIKFSGLDSSGKPYRFTTKICRKTAGAIYLRTGYQLGYVSKLMGHSSVRVTEEHYCNVTALSMQTEMKRVRSL